MDNNEEIDRMPEASIADPELRERLIGIRYYLDGKKPVKCKTIEDVKRAYKLHLSDEKIISVTEVTPDITVSTVFMTFDHRIRATSSPILFETMVFAENDEILNGHYERYIDWDDAVSGHQRMVDYVRNYLKINS